jgi:DNA polymerase-1
MQAAGLMLGIHRRGLDDAAEHYLGIALPKDLQTNDWGASVLSPGQVSYAALDAVIAHRLWPVLIRDVIKAGRGEAYELQRDAIAPTVRMMARRVLLDRAAHQQQIDRWAQEQDDTGQAFTRLRGTPLPETNRQIAALLRQVLPPDVIANWPRTDKTGELSAARAHLTRHEDIPEIALVLTNKKQQKLLSSFGATLAARAHTDGRIRASFNLAQAKTGRMSCTDPNLQQLPRDKRMRDCFVAVPGNLLVVADYNAMELRVWGENAGDMIVRADFARGFDPHRMQAAAMNGIEENIVTRDQRQAAKAINFSIIYGAGPAGIVASVWANYGIMITLATAQAARDRFLGRYRTSAHWMAGNADACQRRGYIAIGKYGRIIAAEWEGTPKLLRRYRSNDEDDEGEDDDNDWEPAYHFVSPLKYTLCCNAPIQGACAEILMRAMILIDGMLRAANIPGGLVLAVHDELVLEVSEDRAAEAAKLLERAMVQAFVEYFPQAPTNGLEVEVHTVRAWGEAKS